MSDPQLAASGGHDEGRMPLMDHLVELRTRLIRMVVAVAVGAVIGFVVYDRIFEVLIDPYRTLCTDAQHALDHLQRVVHDALGQALLAPLHDLVDEAGHQLAVVAGVRLRDTTLDLGSSRHGSSVASVCP